jgi:hypothetical protein
MTRKVGCGSWISVYPLKGHSDGWSTITRGPILCKLCFSPVFPRPSFYRPFFFAPHFSFRPSPRRPPPRLHQYTCLHCSFLCLKSLSNAKSSPFFRAIVENIKYLAWSDPCYPRETLHGQDPHQLEPRLAGRVQRGVRRHRIYMDRGAAHTKRHLTQPPPV